jgi:hypothetical protein
VPAPAQAQPTVTAATIEAAIAAGKTVSYSGVAVTGRLVLPGRLDAALLLHGVSLPDGIDAQETTFGKLVDLRDSTLGASSDFTGATFQGPAVFLRVSATKLSFELATFDGNAFFNRLKATGPVSFDYAEFSGTAGFVRASFGRRAGFKNASFGGPAAFTIASFSGPVDFEEADFSSDADFSSSMFSSEANFDAARFGSAAAFDGVTFEKVIFTHARFEQGGSFIYSEFGGPAGFALTSSPGDMEFDGATFDDNATFATARYTGSTTFNRAEIDGDLNFDEAVLSRLDLDNTTFVAAGPHLFLPYPSQGNGRLDDLRMDPGDVGHVGTGGNEKSGREKRATALALIEAAAKRGGDLRAADQAHVEYQTILRHDRVLPLRLLDWALYWGVAGYFVRPLHQVSTILILLVLFTLIPVVWIRATRTPEKRLSLRTSLRRSLRSMWQLKIHEGTGWQQAEATAYKVVFLLLLLNVANVWPPVHDLLGGLLG